ncbi:MAG: hypothetical protein M3371_12180, partial [Acidobacteriota bacterium]|nr:hypothetical protein [Acidobacteriota bacterium]
QDGKFEMIGARRWRGKIRHNKSEDSAHTRPDAMRPARLSLKEGRTDELRQIVAVGVATSKTEIPPTAIGG